MRLTLGPGDERPVGILAAAAGRIYFEYDSGFLADPLWLSPFKLPPQPGLIEHRERDFGPLPGLFDDSLPDGWGLLLMDRFFQQQQIRPAEVGPLDRLAFLGKRTLGALTYHPPSEQTVGAQPIDLGQLAAASAEILRGGSRDVLPQLLRAGGSPGGARPKVLVGVRGEELISGEEDLPEGFEAWLVKFPSQPRDRDAGSVEEAYARMARAAGIEMPPTRLFEVQKGGPYFGVKRFDRAAGGRRFHIHTFGNLIHANFRLPGCDYRQLLEVTRILTRRQQDVVQQFRRMAFNVAAHNRDDHAKNFSFRIGEQGQWLLSPAYDLIFAEGPGGEHTMTVAGEGKNPVRRHLLMVAQEAGLSSAVAGEILDAVIDSVAGWREHAKTLGIGKRLRDEIGSMLASHRVALG